MNCLQYALDKITTHTFKMYKFHSKMIMQFHLSKYIVRKKLLLSSGFELPSIFIGII